MTDAQIINLTQIAIDELRKEKICLIEDIIKAKKTAFGFGIPGHDDVIKDPSTVFDKLYDMNKDQLDLIWSIVQAEVSQKARELAGFNNGETTSKDA